MNPKRLKGYLLSHEEVASKNVFLHFRYSRTNTKALHALIFYAIALVLEDSEGPAFLRTRILGLRAF